jgi:putative transposase
MPKGLKRYQQTGDLHYVTFSCYRRLPYLDKPRARDIFEEVLEIMRRRHNLWINAYVVMPEHVHLLLSEPEKSLLAVALKALKQESARRLKDSETAHFWQARYYDFNVYSEKKRAEKVDYIHWNPVKRKLVSEPEEWPWSSARHYATGGEQLRVQITSRYTEQKAVVAVRR